MLHEDYNAAKIDKYISNIYFAREGVLYKRGFVMPFLTYLYPYQVHVVLSEVHHGLCGGQPVAQSLALKIDMMGYFWPTMLEDVNEMTPINSP